MSTSSSLRQQFGAFCTNVPLGVRTLLEAPGLTTTLTAPKTALCACPPLGKRFSSTGSTVGGVLKKRRSRRLVCVHPWTKGFLRPLQRFWGKTRQRVFHHHLSQAGDGDTCIASPSTKLAIHGEDISSGRGTDVPAFNTMTPLVHPAAVLCFHGSSCYCPSNTGSSATCSRREFSQRATAVT